MFACFHYGGIGLIFQTLCTHKRYCQFGACTVEAGVPPAVEPGILPGGTRHENSKDARFYRLWQTSIDYSGRQDAALYGSQDGCRYNSDADARDRKWPGFACSGAASMRIYGVRSVV